MVKIFTEGTSTWHVLYIRISLLCCKEIQTTGDKQSSVQYRRLWKIKQLTKHLTKICRARHEPPMDSHRNFKHTLYFGELILNMHRPESTIRDIWGDYVTRPKSLCTNLTHFKCYRQVKQGRNLDKCKPLLKRLWSLSSVMGKLFKEGAKGKERNFRRANIIY